MIKPHNKYCPVKSIVPLKECSDINRYRIILIDVGTYVEDEHMDCDKRKNKSLIFEEEVSLKDK